MDPLAAPVVLPAGAPGLAAVFNRAWPVALSLQCVAAEMLPAEGDGLAGDGLDCAAAPTTLAPRNAAEIRRVLYMGSLPRHSPLANTVQTGRHFTMIRRILAFARAVGFVPHVSQKPGGEPGFDWMIGTQTF